MAVFPLKRGHTVSQNQSDSVCGQILMKQFRHLRVERRHHLVLHLDQRHFHPCMDQVFRHLQADKASSDDSGTPRLLFHQHLLDLIRVRYGPQSVNIRSVNPRNGRYQR